MWGQGPVAAVVPAALWKELGCCGQEWNWLLERSRKKSWRALFVPATLRLFSLPFGLHEQLSPLRLSPNLVSGGFLSHALQETGWTHTYCLSLCFPPLEDGRKGWKWRSVDLQLIMYTGAAALSFYTSASSKRNSLVTLLLPIFPLNFWEQKPTVSSLQAASWWKTRLWMAPSEEHEKGGSFVSSQQWFSILDLEKLW